MTCILAVRDQKNKIWVGADRRVSMGNQCYVNSNPKVFKRDGIIIAYAGDAVLGEMIGKNFKIPARQIKNIDLYVHEMLYYSIYKQYKRRYYDPEKEVDCLFAIKGKLFSLQIVKEKLDIIEIPTPYAIGSGAEFALGSYCTLEDYDLYIEDKIRTALQITAKLNHYCDDKIDIKHE